MARATLGFVGFGLTGLVGAGRPERCDQRRGVVRAIRPSSKASTNGKGSRRKRGRPPKRENSEWDSREEARMELEEDAGIDDGGDVDKDEDDDDVLTPEFEIASPYYIAVSTDGEPVQEEDGKYDGEIMYKLDWRSDEGLQFFEEGSFVSASDYFPKQKIDDKVTQRKLDVSSLGLDVLHPRTTLDEAQIAAVQALCQRRSVLFSSPEQGSELAIIRDVALRCWLWGRKMIYCSPSRRKQERVYALLCEGVGEENVGLDIGDFRQNLESLEESAPTCLVLAPEILHEMVFYVEKRPLRHVQVVMLDDLMHPEDSHKLWEELIVAMPSRVLIAMLCRRLNEKDREELPLWFNHVMNACCKAFRLTRAVPSRAFVFNTETGTATQQIHLDEHGRSSLEKVVACLEAAEDKEERNQFDAAKEYEKEAFDAAHALLTNKPGAAVSVRDSLQFSGNEAELDGSAVARILLRGGSALPTVRTEHLPLLALVHGREEAEMTIRATFSALRGLSLIDVDQEESVRAAVRSARQALEEAGAMSEDVAEWFDFLSIGCAFIHNGLFPIQNALAEELFRSELITLLAVDTHIGPRELTNLSSAKTVVVDSTVISTHARAGKGVVHGSLVLDLVGRRGLDEEGNLIVCWEDGDIASHEMAVDTVAALTESHPQVEAVDVAKQHASILRTLRRFGGEDWQQLWTLSLSELRRSMACEPIAVQQSEKEKQLEILQSDLQNVNWVEIAKLTRLEAKVRERARMLVEMMKHQDSVWGFTVVEKLSTAPSGTIVGVRSYDEDGDTGTISPVEDDEVVLGLSKYVSGALDFALEKKLARPAVLISIDVQPRGKSTATVICTDGLFHRLPVGDILDILPDEKISTTIDETLEVPADGEFDDVEGFGTSARSSKPKVDKLAIKIADELAGLNLSIRQQRPEEIDKQIRRFRKAESDLNDNSYYKQETEVEQLRQRRREMVELRKEIEQLNEKIKEIMQGAPRRKSLPQRMETRLRILDELNCTSAETGEITSMGLVTLHLCCESQFWIMSGILLTDAGKLPWFELAAAVVALSSNFSHSLGRLYEGGEYREEFSAGPVISQILDLRDSIRMIEDKHELDLDGRMVSPLDTRLTRLTRNFVQGDLWQDSISQIALGGLGPGDIIRVLRSAISIASQFADKERQPWIVEDLKRKMTQLAEGLNRVPVTDFHLLHETERLVVQASQESPKLEDVQAWWESNEVEDQKLSGCQSPK